MKRAPRNKRKPDSRTGVNGLSSFLADLVKKKASGVFVMIPFRIFEMLRFPKGKRFFSPQISDAQFLSLLPRRAAELLEDLMQLENPADRLSAFHEMERRSEMALEIRRSLLVRELVEQCGLKQGAARRVAAVGGDCTPAAVRWLREVLQSPDPRTRKMLLFLLRPSSGKKWKQKEIVDRLEFSRIPVPPAKSTADFMKIVSAAHEALKLGFSPPRSDGKEFTSGTLNEE